MKEIVFATPQTVVQPKGRAVIHDQLEQDHVLGASGPEWDVLSPGGKWLEVLLQANFEPEIQVVTDGDTYWCVTFSHNSAKRLLHIKQYGTDLNISERCLAIGSGTIRGQGNGPRAVAEWFRLNGFELQEECPTPSTLDDCYAPLTTQDLARAKERLKTYDSGYKFLPDRDLPTLRWGLTFSPVQLGVKRYAFNEKGYVKNIDGPYIHEVVLLQEMDDFLVTYDSENKQYLKYDKSYQFLTPMIHSFKKKIMNQFYLDQTTKKIYIKGLVDGLLHHITSSDFFHNLWGEYKNVKFITGQSANPKGPNYINEKDAGEPYGPVPGTGFSEQDLAAISNS